MSQDEINQGESSNPKNWSMLIYCSRLGGRFFVPKRMGFGVTVNFGHCKYGTVSFVTLFSIILVSLLAVPVTICVLVNILGKK